MCITDECLKNMMKSSLEDIIELVVKDFIRFVQVKSSINIDHKLLEEYLQKGALLKRWEASIMVKNLRGVCGVKEEDKRSHLVQLRYTENEYQNMWEAAPDTTQDRIALLIRRATHEYYTKTVAVTINGE